MIKKLTSLMIGLLVLFNLAKPVVAQSEETILYFFWSQSCPHCAQEKLFLESLEEKYPDLIIKDFEVSGDQENLALLQAIGQRFKVPNGAVPFTAVGEKYFLGYLNDQVTGQQIETAVKEAIESGSTDLVADLIEPAEKEKGQGLPEKLNLPLFGQVELKSLSLPVITFLIALLDGFNPCAMWALLFLISLLLGMEDRKKMWLLGVTFILTSGLVYFLFLAAWLNLFLFLGFIFWVRLVVALVALAAGGYSLRVFWLNREGGCEAIEGEEKRAAFFERIKTITQKKEIILALGGVVLLAVAVNLIELVCSAGLPAVYSQILSLTELPLWQYYFYLLFYTFVFILDDLLVFLIAMVTLRAVGIQNKYARYSRLIGGILMLIIGFLLLFKPEWLMFS